MDSRKINFKFDSSLFSKTSGTIIVEYEDSIIATINNKFELVPTSEVEMPSEIKNIIFEAFGEKVFWACFSSLLGDQNEKFENWFNSFNCDTLQETTLISISDDTWVEYNVIQIPQFTEAFIVYDNDDGINSAVFCKSLNELIDTIITEPNTIVILMDREIN